MRERADGKNLQVGPAFQNHCKNARVNCGDVSRRSAAHALGYRVFHALTRVRDRADARHIRKGAGATRVSEERKHDGRPHDATEHAIEQLRAATTRTIVAWTDAELDAVIQRLRQDSRGRPDNFALLMFLEDARLYRHEARFRNQGDGLGPSPAGIN